MCFANFMFLLKRGTWHSKGQCSLIQEPSNKSFWKLYSCAFCTAPCSVVQFWNQSVCSTRNWQNLKWSLKFELLSTSGNREPLRLSAVEYRGDRFPAWELNQLKIQYNYLDVCTWVFWVCESNIGSLYIQLFVLSNQSVGGDIEFRLWHACRGIHKGSIKSRPLCSQANISIQL